MQARLIHLWLAEPIFFASRELSDTYLTEGVLGNYALAYALGWAKSPYRLEDKQASTPTYQQDLSALTDYIFPAWPEKTARYRFERFNAISDAYWFAMTNNRVATARELIATVRAGEKPGEFRPSNYPQSGRFRLLARDQVFQTLVLGDRELPAYVRVGKFNSKVKVTVQESWEAKPLPEGTYTFTGILNPADVGKEIQFSQYNLINVPPVPLLQHARFNGAAWKIGDWLVPAGLRFLGKKS